MKSYTKLELSCIAVMVTALIGVYSVSAQEATVGYNYRDCHPGGNVGEPYDLECCHDWVDGEGVRHHDCTVYHDCQDTDSSGSVYDWYCTTNRQCYYCLPSNPTCDCQWSHTHWACYFNSQSRRQITTTNYSDRVPNLYMLCPY